MKPDWDKLMDEFKESKTALVADVDCTAGGKDLCEKVGVQGYPTIKYGDPEDLKDYDGGRDLAALKKFAEENLGPTCGVDNLDLCDESSKAEIEKFQKMSPDELAAAITEAEARVKKVEDKGQKAVNKLIEQLADLDDKKERATKKKDEDVFVESKKIGLRFMKSVASFKKKNDEDSAPKKKKGKKGKKGEL